MWLFLKKFYRDLGESKGQFLSVLVVVMIGVMFYTGMNTALAGVEGAGEKYFEQYRLADIWSSVLRAPEGAVDRVESIPGVKTAEGRVVQNARIEIGDRDAMVRLISLPDQKRDTVNGIMLTSGSYFSAETGNECIVSENFFKANGLSMGQTIEPILNGNRVKLKVVGTEKSPEYTYELREASDLVPDPKKFGLVYVRKSYLQNITGFQDAVNDISVLLEQDGDGKTVVDEMKKMLKQYGENSTMERKDQLSYSMFHSDVEGLKSMGTSFPMIFFIASAVIIYITMTRMIENQRTLMGVLKALGYSDTEIMLHYQTYPVLVGVLGSVLGALMGFFVLGKAMLGLYNQYYNLPMGNTEVHWELLLPASLLALLFCIAAGYNACRRELRLMPAESMRPKPPASGKKIFLENLRIFWKNINFSWKIIVRNIFRYKKRSAMASVGIIFSMVLILMAMGMQDSVDYMMGIQFRDIQKYDLKVNFSKVMNADELNYLRSIDHIETVEPLLESGMEITNGWRKKDIGLIALDPDSKLYGVLDADGNRAAIPRDGILLPGRLMNTLGLKPGKTAYLRSFYPGKNGDEDKKQVLVRGSTMEILGQSAVCSTDYLDYLLREGTVINAAYLKLENPEYEGEVTKDLKNIISVNTVQSKSEIVSNIEKTMGTMTSMIAIMILGAGILTFAVIYNITNINIFERRREIATLAVLGFTTKELKKLVFHENFFLSAFGALVGVLPGKMLTQLMIATSATDTMWLPSVLDPSSYLVAAALIAFFTWTANLLLGKKVGDIDMVESLKSAE